MDRYREIRDNLIFTYHSKDNFFGNRRDCNRTDISIHQIVSAIAYGKLGFAGSHRMIKTYKGVTVVYKIDKLQNKYVVITYYKSGSKYKSKIK